MSGKKKIQVRKPGYYDRFRCKASDCSENCCVGWEIDIDEVTANQYRQMTGELGRRLRDMIEWPEREEQHAEEMEEEQPPHFILQGERCPFLEKDNLCEIIRELGEENLCEICREHPRYYEWFEGLTEKGLGLCCEAAAELILESPEKAGFVLCFEEEEEEDGDNLAPPLLVGLLIARETAFYLLQNRERPAGERLALYLMYAEDIQDYLDVYAEYREFSPCDEQKLDGASLQTAKFIIDISRLYRNEVFTGRLLKECAVSAGGKTGKDVAEGYEKMLGFLHALEPITGAWPVLLESLLRVIEPVLEKRDDFKEYIKRREYEYEHLSVYFIYRYFMKSYFDGDLLSKAKFAVTAVLVMRLIAVWKYAEEGQVTLSDQVEIAGFCSRELEYSQENLDAFTKEAWSGGVFSRETLFGLLL